MTKEKPPSADEIRCARALHALGCTNWQIAKVLETHYRRVRKVLAAAGLEPRAVGYLTEEGRAVKAAASAAGKGRVRSQESRARIKAAKLAHGERHAKGRALHQSGYVRITRGLDRGRAEHRIVAEKIFGRRLRSDEHVHHVDQNRSNNSPENLQVMTSAEHARLHGELEKWQKKVSTKSSS